MQDIINNMKSVMKYFLLLILVGLVVSAPFTEESQNLSRQRRGGSSRGGSYQKAPSNRNNNHQRGINKVFNVYRDPSMLSFASPYASPLSGRFSGWGKQGVYRNDFGLNQLTHNNNRGNSRQNYRQ